MTLRIGREHTAFDSFVERFLAIIDDFLRTWFRCRVIQVCSVEGTSSSAFCTDSHQVSLPHTGATSKVHNRSCSLLWCRPHRHPRQHYHSNCGLHSLGPAGQNHARSIESGGEEVGVGCHARTGYFHSDLRDGNLVSDQRESAGVVRSFSGLLCSPGGMHRELRR